MEEPSGDPPSTPSSSDTLRLNVRREEKLPRLLARGLGAEGQHDNGLGVLAGRAEPGVLLSSGDMAKGRRRSRGNLLDRGV